MVQSFTGRACRTNLLILGMTYLLGERAETLGVVYQRVISEPAKEAHALSFLPIDIDSTCPSLQVEIDLFSYFPFSASQLSTG